jgi:hypothetical protein
MSYFEHVSDRAHVRPSDRYFKPIGRCTRRALLVAVSGLVCAGCQPGGENNAEMLAGLFSGVEAEWIDMTYSYDERAVFWPTAQPFELEVVSAGITEGGYYYAANNFCLAEHGGTHFDAPIHFAEGQHTSEQVPIDRLIGPAVVVDVSAAAEGDPDYQVDVGDLQEWEAEHGRIPDGLIRNGSSALRRRDPKRFPSFTSPACTATPPNGWSRIVGSMPSASTRRASTTASRRCSRATASSTPRTSRRSRTWQPWTACPRRAPT